MNPRQEAFDRLGGRYEVRVLEPSPPAVDEGPWWADDPLARGHVPPGRRLVSPIEGAGDLTWEQLAQGDPALREWCAQRWLVTHHGLHSPPSLLVRTRVSLHRLAAHVISPARAAANGKIGLRYTRGGFGTPFFGGDEQIRVEGDRLVIVRHGGERGEQITTLAAAAATLGVTLGEQAAACADETLRVDIEASIFLGEWYGFAASVLETLRARAGPADGPSRVQLWPEHFDLAVELGSEAAGARATCGCSPGDAAHAEPYLYVAPWKAPPAGELWQAAGFPGAELPYARLLEMPDPRAGAVAFYADRLAALTERAQA